MPTTTAAGLLAAVGVFDIVGTIASGWLTDRFDPCKLLVIYYTFRGMSLVLLPALLSSTVHPSIVVFIVIYGLDWVATVPPTSMLCQRIFGSRGYAFWGGAALCIIAAVMSMLAKQAPPKAGVTAESRPAPRR